MSRPRTYEARLLTGAHALITDALTDLGSPPAARLELLEATACTHSGLDLTQYRTHFPQPRATSVDAVGVWGEKLHQLLTGLPIPLPLALAGLAQPLLQAAEARTAGAYYTDFRLATYLASRMPATYPAEEKVIDLACGSGILLAALTLHVAAGSRATATNFVAHQVCGADLHADAVNTTRAVLTACVDDLAAVVAVDARLIVGDSLTRPDSDFAEIAPLGFGAVIGNPPWEKLKVTRHEHLKATGAKRHYGQAYTGDNTGVPITGDAARYTTARAAMRNYVTGLGQRTRLQGGGESDLYKLFLERAVALSRPDAHLGLLVPAGLIRSQGTYTLREFLLDHTSDLQVSVLDNRALFFSIDTRFKFLVLTAQLGIDDAGPSLILRHGRGDEGGVIDNAGVDMGRAELAALRPDLTVPEVRTEREWAIFAAMAAAGTTLADPGWAHRYSRELDMTKDRPAFIGGGTPSPSLLAVLEGRMVHQHRARAKAHRSGTGRAAVWEPLGLGAATCAPQFTVPARVLDAKLAARVTRARAGFCDVTGQTNERTLLAAVVEPNTVCGNKVPTLTFEGSDSVGRTREWVALANTVVVDWAARRVVTTSMNYFLLLSLPLPVLDADTAAGVRADAALLAAAETQPNEASDLVAARVRIDVAAAHAFGLDLTDLQIMLADFPLLDRGQPALPGETRSSVTTDTLLAAYAAATGMQGPWQGRADAAYAVGAQAYTPSEYAI